MTRKVPTVRHGNRLKSKRHRIKIGDYPSKDGMLFWSWSRLEPDRPTDLVPQRSLRQV